MFVRDGSFLERKLRNLDEKGPGGPALEFDHLKRDLHYLGEKGYVERVLPEPDKDNGLTPWRCRWFRLTTSGIELADRCINDPALEE